MNSSSWWSRKLGGEDAVPTERPTYPPRSPATASHAVRDPYPDVTRDNAYEAAMQWRGGEATMREGNNCPNCGSHLYFSRSNSPAVATQTGMARVPARCYSCGHTDGRPMQGTNA